MTIATPRPWRANDEAQFRSLALEGTSSAVIAKRLGRTEEAVRNRAQRLGISAKTPNVPGNSDHCRLLELGPKAKGK